MSNSPEQMMDNQNQAQQQQQQLMNYQFSKEELKVLQECNTESFFQRSLPLGTGLAMAAFYAVKKGYLQPNVRFGPGPKVVAAAVFGYFVGKFSYQSKCAEKLMRIPNSRLAELLKQRKKGALYENLTPDQGFGAGLSLAPFAPSGDHYSDEHLKDKQSGGALDIDTSRPTNSGLDDTFRLTLDSPQEANEDEQLAASKKVSSYDDLRKKNREDYLKRQESPYNRPLPADEGQPVVRKPEARRDENSEEAKNAKKNKYGDVWT